MSTPNDGGPAFACASENFDQTGMSLRDWFAGQAITGVADTCQFDTLRPRETTAQMFARKAYDLADAMLAARQVTSADPLAEMTKHKESWQAQTIELENQLIDLRRERDRLRAFIETINEANGPYPELNCTAIVPDAYQALKPIEPNA